MGRAQELQRVFDNGDGRIVKGASKGRLELLRAARSAWMHASRGRCSSERGVRMWGGAERASGVGVGGDGATFGVARVGLPESRQRL